MWELGAGMVGGEGGQVAQLAIYRAVKPYRKKERRTSAYFLMPLLVNSFTVDPKK